MRAGLTAAVAVLGLAACGASDARPVAVSTVTTAAPSPVVAERDPLPIRERVVPTTRASRSLPGGRAAEGVHPRAAVRQPITGGDVWARLAMCESGMRNIRNHPYSGYFQFTRPTWQSLGYGGEAADHDYATQLAAAKRLLARSGAGQWPVCSRKVGLR